MSKTRCKEERLEHIRLSHEDVLDLRFEDAYFDCVLSMNGLQSFPDKDHAFDKMYGVLKPGGFMCGSFYIKGHNQIADWIAHKLLRHKGVFIPPHYTQKSALKKLTEYFGNSCKAECYGSILVFMGTKG